MDKILLALATVTTSILFPAQLSEPVVTIESKPVVVVVDQKTHRREVWLSALEWCESAGRKTAINKMDVDGTPSYYSYQFKPATFRSYAIRYGMLSPTSSKQTSLELMKDYETQREIVRRMIDDPKVNWYREFPDCTKNKIGLPPKN